MEILALVPKQHAHPGHASTEMKAPSKEVLMIIRTSVDTGRTTGDVLENIEEKKQVASVRTKASQTRFETTIAFHNTPESHTDLAVVERRCTYLFQIFCKSKRHGERKILNHLFFNFKADMLLHEHHEE
jgi:hypothetical protein